MGAALGLISRVHRGAPLLARVRPFEYGMSGTCCLFGKVFTKCWSSGWTRHDVYFFKVLALDPRRTRIWGLKFATEWGRGSPTRL